MTTAIRKSRGAARSKMLREINGVPDDYMTTGGAADYLGVTPAAVWLAYQEGRLQGERFGKLACFTREQLDAYDARRTGKGLPMSASLDTPPAQGEANATAQQTPEGGQERDWDAPPARGPEPPTPASPVPCAQVQTHYTWSDVQAAALVGKTRQIPLSGGGLLYLCYDVDLFTLSERERHLLFTLIDAVKQFEGQEGAKS